MKLLGRAGVGRLPALAAMASAALLLGPTSSFGATANTVFEPFAVDSPDLQVQARFPERLADAGDLTGDGVRDVFAGNYLLDVAGVTDAGKVSLISGADRSVRYELTSPEIQQAARFGFNISVPGDVNGDGKDDLVVGAPYQGVYTGTGTPCGAPEPNGCNENQGKAYVYSGPTGKLLYVLDNPQPQADEGVFATFGARIGAAGDVNGDGRADIIIGSPANDVPAGCGNLTPIPADCRKNEGEAFIFNGANGALVRTLRIPDADKQEPTCTTTSSTARCGNFSNAQSPGDVDGDGVADQMVAAYALRRPNIVAPQFFGRVYLFSGKTGAVLSRIDQPVADSNAFWGLDDVAPNTPGDVSGDGVPDLYVMGFNQDGAAGENAAGRGWVFDGKASVAAGTGVVLFEPKDPSPRAGEAFGWAASRTDYNKDGRPDLYLSGLAAINTETFLYDGRDGSLLKTLGLSGSEAQPNVPGNNGSGLGWSSRAPGDLNADGEPDFIAAAPFQDVLGNQDQGKLYFFLSKVPAPAPVPTPTPTPTPTPIPTPNIPGIVLDRTAPTVKLSGVPSSMSLKAFLRGVRAKVSRNERSSIDATLEGRAKKATLAAAYNLSLASRAVKLGTGTSTITLKPSKKLVGRAKKLSARVRVVVTDGAGNRRTVTKSIRVKR